jgi:hypothetical protein
MVDLQLFLNIVDEGSITQGAAKSNLSLAAASTRITLLEHPMDTITSPLASIGIDIGKEVFHIVGFGTDGKIAFRRKIKRLALTETSRSCRLVWSEWRHASARVLSAGPCVNWAMS